VNAGLDFGRIENELRLAAFLLHGVITLNRNLSEWIAIACKPVAEDNPVDGVRASADQQQAQENQPNPPSKSFFDSSSQGSTPGASL
jgi:hypothetical protein